ncbi:transketolase family protein [Fodinisporobacter ferrooxydans]|uniref:Transketolase family protein n=1 Tax=Fodinisporobacter ferrooxydans TaxID=2901836 RepID=A0ABY4CDU7_9BACL|nr:transketolase family protein [Alicyclobacillaceae bacterium MYW30-H2]
MLENPSAAYCDELIQIANERPEIVLITADTVDIIGLGKFMEMHPDRLYDVGIAEQAMTNIAAGFASVGFLPFVSAFAMFQSLRAADNIRNGIAYPNFNVKIVAANIGLNVGKNGVTHHALEDIAVIRAIPNMIVVSPADGIATRRLVCAITEVESPCYMRIDKIPIPVVYDTHETFELGKGKLLREGKNVTLVATGSAVHTTLQAASILVSRGIDPTVVDMHTIKPLDEDLIVRCAKRTQAVITVEPHSIIGGLGGAVAEALSARYPTIVKRIGVADTFTESGSADELNRKYHLDVESIVHEVEQLVQVKATSI